MLKFQEGEPTVPEKEDDTEEKQEDTSTDEKE